MKVKYATILHETNVFAEVKGLLGELGNSHCAAESLPFYLNLQALAESRK